MAETGQRVTRVEDARLLTGRGLFADDVDRPGQLHLRVVRSTLAHARVVGVDASAASALPGVVGVLTAHDVATLPPIPVRISPEPETLAPYLQPVLAAGVVRYVGEPVAAVVATDPYLAEDAAELVEVDYEAFPAVVDPTEALGHGAPSLFAGHGNEVTEIVAAFGDVDAAFARAAHVVRVEVGVGRQTAVPLETRGLVAQWHPSGALEVWGATKVPHFNRAVLATMLGVEPGAIRMHRGDAGGGFGVRGELYPEDVLVPFAARRYARPVKWIEDRAEHLVAANHSRDQHHAVAGAFDASGRLLALRDDVLHDNGAYLRTHGVTVPELTASMLPGPYRMEAFEARVHVVVTNKTPSGTYRAPGRYEGTLARERLLDAAAEALGMDPVELRRRNLLGPDELPCDRRLQALGTPVVLDEGDYPGLLDAALDAAGYRGWEKEAAAARAQGRLVGCGMAVFLEKSGLGPYEVATVALEPSGRLHVAVGGTSLGQGIETVMAQIAADALGVRTDEVDVVAGDTAEVADGLGSWASRSSVVGGSAVHLAGTDVRLAASQIAAEMLEAAPEDVVVEGGRAFVAGSPDRAVTLGAVARAGGAVARAGRDEPADRDDAGAAADAAGRVPSLRSTRTFAVSHMTYPYGVHFAQVEVDPGTGGVQVRRYFVAYEVGRSINPMTVEGQIVGGAIQGIGGALYEELRFDGDGQPLSATLMGYQLPFATEAPDVGMLVSEQVPATSNPLGVRGAGEGGMTACAAAVASAVGSAVGRPGATRRVPLTPDVVLRLLAETPMEG